MDCVFAEHFHRFIYQVPHSVLVTRHANLTCDYVSLAENISYGFSHDVRKERFK